MPSLDNLSNSPFVKLMLIGNSGAGKTGALASLVPDYNLRIIDLDSGLQALRHHAREIAPDRLGSIQFESYRDMMKATPQGTKVDGSPKAFVNTLNALDTWPEDGSNPAEWGADSILVLDSLTNAGRAAFLWAKAMNPTSKDPRQWYSAAQTLIEDLIANLTSDTFATNVVVISHVDLIETQTGIRGYASSIGKALGPKLPRFFNTLILSEIKGSGDNVKRTLKTVPTSMIDLKNPMPSQIKSEYDISDGMAKIFATLRS